MTVLGDLRFAMKLERGFQQHFISLSRVIALTVGIGGHFDGIRGPFLDRSIVIGRYANRPIARYAWQSDPGAESHFS